MPIMAGSVKKAWPVRSVYNPYLSSFFDSPQQSSEMGGAPSGIFVLTLAA
jgi:hypothetical protein